MTSHMLRRTPESTCASCPNSKIPAIPHIYFLTYSAPTDRDSGNRIENFEVTDHRILEGRFGRDGISLSCAGHPFENLGSRWTRNESLAAPFRKTPLYHDNVCQPPILQFAIEQLRIAGPVSALPRSVCSCKKNELRILLRLVTIATNSINRLFADRRERPHLQTLCHRPQQYSAIFRQRHLGARPYHGTNLLRPIRGRYKVFGHFHSPGGLAIHQQSQACVLRILLGRQRFGEHHAPFLTELNIRSKMPKTLKPMAVSSLGDIPDKPKPALDVNHESMMQHWIGQSSVPVMPAAKEAE